MFSEAELRPHLLSSVPEHTLLPGIEQLQKAFIGRDSKLINSYGGEEFLVSLYSLIYLPTNMSKFSFLMEQLPSELLSSFENRTFIDIGAGPGTYSLAYAKFFKRGHVISVDHGPAMIKQSKKFWDSLVASSELTCEWKTSTRDLKRNEDAILFFGNSLNEMGVTEALKVIETVKPRDIVLVEPGTSEVFKELLGLRGKLLSKGFKVSYPCLSNGPCPLEGGSKDWCHQVVRTSHELGIERLCQIGKIDRKVMPMSAQVFTREDFSTDSNGADSSERITRSFRFKNETKFSYDWEVCENCQGQNKIAKVSFPKKKMEKSLQKKMKKTSVGGLLKFEELKKSDKTVIGKLLDC